MDIGGGTTDVAIFKDGIIRHTAVIPFGGNVITEDIKEGCTIIQNQAELLKIKFGSAWPDSNSENEIVSIPGLRGREPKEISLKNLSRIINARVVEIIEQVHLEIQNYGYDDPKKKLIAGIVLTGGGAKLKHIKQLVEYVTGMDTRIGFPNEHLASGADKELASPTFATAVGLVIKGLESKGISRNKPVTTVESPKTIQAEQQANAEANTEAKAEDHIPENESETDEATQAMKKRSSFFDKWVEGFKEFLANEG